MGTDREQVNLYTRVCIVVLLFLLGGLILWSFSFGNPRFQITSSILLALSLMVIAILADSFNSISFGTIFHLKKDIARAETEKKEAKDESRELRLSLVNMVSSLHQSQVTTNIAGLDVGYLRQALGVIEASPEDKELAEEEIPDTSKQVTSDTVMPGKENWKKELRKNMEDYLFHRFTEKYTLTELDIRRNVRFDGGIGDVDPIMNRTLIYDGYVNTGQKEYFIISLPINRNSLLADRLYVLLAKIFFYKQIKKIDTELVLLQATFPESESKVYEKNTFAEWFKPAIAAGFLRIENFEISKKEYDRLYNLALEKTS